MALNCRLPSSRDSALSASFTTASRSRGGQIPYLLPSPPPLTAHRDLKHVTSSKPQVPHLRHGCGRSLHLLRSSRFPPSSRLPPLPLPAGLRRRSQNFIARRIREEDGRGGAGAGREGEVRGEGAAAGRDGGEEAQCCLQAEAADAGGGVFDGRYKARGGGRR
eukprot:764420-Hanusia_phi.AAC.1